MHHSNRQNFLRMRDTLPSPTIRPNLNQYNTPSLRIKEDPLGCTSIPIYALWHSVRTDTHEVQDILALK